MRPLVRRRLFLLASGAFSLASPALARRRDYVDLREIVGTRGGPHTAMIAEAFAQARLQNMKVIAGAGTYLLDDELPIRWEGFAFEGEGEKTRFIQTKPMKGFLQLLSHGARVKGFSLTYEGERTRTPGYWRGYREFQRACAVWIEGDRNTVSDVSGENTFGVVCLRGPVVPLPATAGAGQRLAFDFTKRAVGNQVINVSGRDTDFVLTGNQQQDLLIDGLTARGTTNKSVPPHAIYMQNPGSTTAFCGYCLRVTAKRLDSVGNPYHDAYKFSDIRDLTIEGVKAHDTLGGLMVSTSDGVIVKGMDWSFRGPRARTAVRVTQSTRVRVIGGQSSGNGGAILSYHGSEAVDVEGFRTTDEFRPDDANAPYRVADTSEAQFLNCHRERVGADRSMFVVTGKGTATITDPECRGSSLLVHCSAEATVSLRVDPKLIDGWSPRKSIAGARDRVRNFTVDAEKQKRVSRPLPGAVDNACP